VHIAGALLTAILLFALFRSLREDGPAALAAWRDADVDAVWVAIAAIVSLAAHAFFIHGWKVLLVDSAVPVTFWQAARLFLVSNLGRYLPAGKAWQMGIVGMLAAESDLPVARIVAASLFQGAVGVLVGLLLLALTGSTVLHLGPIWLLVSIAGIIAVVALPVLNKAIPHPDRPWLRWTRTLDTITPRTMFTVVWTAALNWIAWGVALYALAMAVLPHPEAPLAAYVAAWIGPFLAGLIATFAPAGIGVRDELMRAVLTNAGLPAASALVLVIIARVWTTLFEIIPAIAILALRWWSRRNHN
jgi:uncharacterized membrane protein YbhN (UPF0104 family)